MLNLHHHYHYLPTTYLPFHSIFVVLLGVLTAGPAHRPWNHLGRRCGGRGPGRQPGRGGWAPTPGGRAGALAARRGQIASVAATWGLPGSLGGGTCAWKLGAIVAPPNQLISHRRARARRTAQRARHRRPSSHDCRSTSRCGEATAHAGAAHHRVEHQRILPDAAAGAVHDVREKRTDRVAVRRRRLRAER